MSGCLVNTLPRVLIVDPRLEDYARLSRQARSLWVGLEFATTGSSALNIGRTSCVDLWLINTKLPDMSGFDLLDMLRSVQADSMVFLIDDDYESECERRALMMQADQYLCKPVALSWLATLRLPRRRAGATTVGLPHQGSAAGLGSLVYTSTADT